MYQFKISKKIDLTVCYRKEDLFKLEFVYIEEFHIKT